MVADQAEAAADSEQPVREKQHGFGMVFGAAAMTLVLGVIGGWMASFLIYAPTWSHGVAEWIGVGVLAFVVLADTLFVTMLFRHGVRAGAAGSGSLLVIMLFCAASLGVSNSVKMRCGAWSYKAGAHFRSMGMFMLKHLDRGEALPPSMVVHMIEVSPDWARNFDQPCGMCRLEMVKIGRYTLADLEAGRVTIDELKAEAEAVAAREPDRWEQMGTFWISHDRAIWESKDPNVIGGFLLDMNPSGTRTVTLLYADTRVETTYLSPGRGLTDLDDLALLKSNLMATNRLSLPLPPKELFDFLGVDMKDLIEQGTPK